jgi:hypothetical protein
MGPAVAVATPPSPPLLDLSPTPIPSNHGPARIETAAAPPPNKSGGMEISDIWHPTRAVRKGIEWAGDQLPDFGGDKPAAPEMHAVKPTAPIPLLPSGALTDAPAAKPGKPGPGSGGLY